MGHGGGRRGLAGSSTQSHTAATEASLGLALSSEARVGRDPVLAPSGCCQNSPSRACRTEIPVNLTVGLGPLS